MAMRISGPVSIIRPLDPKLLKELKLEGHGNSPTEDLIANINAAICASTVIWELGRLAVLRIGPDIVVKIAAKLDLNHLTILDHIRLHAPDLPIHNVLGVCMGPYERTYIWMDHVKGQPLDRLWPDFTEKQKLSVQAQLGTMFTRLRAIPRQPTASGDFPLGSGEPRRCKDRRRHMRESIHPIHTEDEFNKFLFDRPRSVCGHGHTTKDMIRSFMRTDHDIVLTHGDLHPRNIMVSLVQEPDEQRDSSSSGEVIYNPQLTGVVDWETAGWYPSYWEFAKALETIYPHDGLTDWWAYLPTMAIGSWGAEYAIDRMVEQYVWN
jgi:hypothetical protein